MFLLEEIIEKDKWLSQKIVQEICAEGNILVVPEFYYGKFTSWDEIEQYIGKTVFGISNGEGIIIKNQTKLNNPNNREPFVVKLVAIEYQETAQRKIKKPINQEKIALQEYKNEMTSTIITKNRIEKNIYKMIMDGLIPEDWDENNMQFIAKNLPQIIYNDCIKEEKEIVDKIEGFGKFCATHTMNFVKEILNKR